MLNKLAKIFYNPPDLTSGSSSEEYYYEFSKEYYFGTTQTELRRSEGNPEKQNSEDSPYSLKDFKRDAQKLRLQIRKKKTGVIHPSINWREVIKTHYDSANLAVNEASGLEIRESGTAGSYCCWIIYKEGSGHENRRFSLEKCFKKNGWEVTVLRALRYVWDTFREENFPGYTSLNSKESDHLGRFYIRKFYGGDCEKVPLVMDDQNREVLHPDKKGMYQKFLAEYFHPDESNLKRAETFKQIWDSLDESVPKLSFDETMMWFLFWEQRCSEDQQGLWQAFLKKVHELQAVFANFQLDLSLRESITRFKVRKGVRWPSISVEDYTVFLQRLEKSQPLR